MNTNLPAPLKGPLGPTTTGTHEWAKQTSRYIKKLEKALKPFAQMDRPDDQDMDKVACVRGYASDRTMITSQDFRVAALALKAKPKPKPKTLMEVFKEEDDREA